ncbi:SymE family type I addiction module toxin [Xanthomonas dyei]|uniref:SymE family type I addiction module toxin n=1 Tax=Xanthomonas dyei TaxID=743699 RepID=UPI0031B9DCA8
MRFLTSRHPVATLRLRGRWLEQLDFAIGKKLHVKRTRKRTGGRPGHRGLNR